MPSPRTTCSTVTSPTRATTTASSSCAPAATAATASPRPSPSTPPTTRSASPSPASRRTAPTSPTRTTTPTRTSAPRPGHPVHLQERRLRQQLGHLALRAHRLRHRCPHALRGAQRHAGRGLRGPLPDRDSRGRPRPRPHHPRRERRRQRKPRRARRRRRHVLPQGARHPLQGRGPGRLVLQLGHVRRHARHHERLQQRPGATSARWTSWPGWTPRR